MIKTMASNAAFFAMSDIPGADATDTLNEINHKVNDAITIVSSYYGTCEYNKRLEALASMNVKDGDLLLMFQAKSKSRRCRWPEGFVEIIPIVKPDKKLSLRVACKIWRKNEATSFCLDKNSKKFFINLLTIRGVTNIFDAEVAYSDRAPRVRTAENSAVISAFAHGDDRLISIPDQKNICSINRNGGLSVSVVSGDGGLSKRAHAIGAVGENDNSISLAMTLK